MKKIIFYCLFFFVPFIHLFSQKTTVTGWKGEPFICYVTDGHYGGALGGYGGPNVKVCWGDWCLRGSMFPGVSFQQNKVGIASGTAIGLGYRRITIYAVAVFNMNFSKVWSFGTGIGVDITTSKK